MCLSGDHETCYTNLETIDPNAQIVVNGEVEPRASFAELGERVGLSRTQVRERIDQLIAEGVATVTAVSDPRIGGIGVRAIVGVTVMHDAAGVADHVAAIDEAIFVTEVVGKFDILGEVHCIDVGHLSSVLSSIRTIEHVRSVESWVILESFKQVWDGTTLGPSDDPIRTLEVLEFDDTDRRLIDALERDGRASYTALGATIGLSVSATRQRVKRLVDGGAVRFVVVPGPAAIDVITYVGIFLDVEGPLASTIETLCSYQESNTVHALNGSYDIGVETTLADINHLRDLLERVRFLPQVTSMEFIVYLRSARYYEHERTS